MKVKLRRFENRILLGKLKIIMVIISIILFPEKRAFAYRPFTTEDAGVAGAGVYQLEYSWDYVKWRNGDKEEILLFVLIYGISENIELSAEIPYMFHNPGDGGHQDGIGDINLVGKYLLLNQSGWVPCLTLKGIVKIDTGDEEKGLGSGYREYSLSGVATEQFEKLAIHAMAGFIVNENNGNDNIRDITYQFGIALDYKLSSRLSIVSEVNTYRHPDRSVKDNPASILVGLIYFISEKIAVDGGVRFGLNDPAPRWSSTMGITLTF